jgi:hypothetical protein
METGDNAELQTAIDRLFAESDALLYVIMGRILIEGLENAE